eukprot:g6326.t1
MLKGAKALALVVVLASVTAHETTRKMELTFFGARDNCPPGGNIAHPTIHAAAGGVGTFEDPITFAGAEKALEVGGIVYIPMFKKYFIFEDACEGCEIEWRDNKKLHIDLWMGPDTLGNGPLIACENALTSLEPQPVTVNATKGHPVDTTPFFTYENGCMVEAPPCHDQGNTCGNLCELYGDLGGKTCKALARTLLLNYTRFKQLNPSLDCSQPVSDGTTVCMGGSCGGRR